MGAARLTLDWRVLAFSAVAAVGSALTFGLAPALRGSQVAPQDGLRDGGRGTAGARSHWFQHSLIVVETALAVVLLTCGGLLLQTFQHLRNTDLGFRSERLLTFETPLFRYKEFDRRVAFINAEVEEVRAIPGVVSAGAISRIPVHEHRQRDLLSAGRPAQIQHPAAGRAHAQRQPRLLRHGRRDAAATADSSPPSDQASKLPWPSSTSRLPIATSKASLHSAGGSSSAIQVKKATGTRLSAS